MKVCIDSADVNEIRRLYDLYPIDGVSTNPTILSRTKREPFEVLKEIRSIIGYDKELFVQVVAMDAEGMVRDAKRIIVELGENTIIKIPCIPEGYKAMKKLNELGIRMLGTAVYTTMQGFMAAKCGCEYIAPYVNRIEKMGLDGIGVAKEIHDSIKNSGYEYSGLLAASFKRVDQVVPLAEYGVKGVTLSPDLFDVMFNIEEVNSAVDKFVEDFEGLTSKGITMESCR